VRTRQSRSKAWISGKSLAVLLQSQDLEFHSLGNIETLAILGLTIEEELKSARIFRSKWRSLSAQEAFSSTIAAFIETINEMREPANTRVEMSDALKTSRKTAKIFVG